MNDQIMRENKDFPLELKVPNAETFAAMEEARQLMAEKSLKFTDARAMFDELETHSELFR